MDDYLYARRCYFSVIEATSGRGRAGQHYVKDAYDKMYKAYTLLTNEEKNNIGPLPPYIVSKDDGASGVRSGIWY